MPRQGRWTVEPGRNLYFDGQPAFSLSSEGDVRNVPHVVVDGATHLIADFFNREGITLDTIYEQHMGHAPRRSSAREPEDAHGPALPRPDREIEQEAREVLRQIDEDMRSRPQVFDGWDGTFSGLTFADANEYLPPTRGSRALTRGRAIIREVDRMLAERRQRRRLFRCTRP